MRGLQILEQLPHCGQQLIIREHRDTARGFKRNGRSEQLILRIEEIDQRALPELIFLLVGVNDLAIGGNLPDERGNPIGGEGSCGPSLVDRLISSALQSSVSHRLLLILLGGFGAFPRVLAATENVPACSDIPAYVGVASKNQIGVVPAQRASFQRDRRHECTGGGVEIVPGGVPVGLRGLNCRIMVKRDRERFVLRSRQRSQPARNPQIVRFDADRLSKCAARLVERLLELCK